MMRVEPKVYLLGYTTTYDYMLNQWLDKHFGFDADAFRNIDEQQQLIEVAGRRCYKSFKEGLNPNVTKIRKDSNEYIANIIKSGHGSVFEHVNTVWAFENVSRVFTHELVRHRVGVGISQESLRYVRLDELGFWIPPCIQENDEACKIFIETIEMLERQQKRLAEIFDIENKSFNEKKKLTSAFRRIAPMGLATGIVWSANIRTLRHVIEMRTSIHAEEEIRDVFRNVASLCEDMWPNLFVDMHYNHQTQEYTFENKKI